MKLNIRVASMISLEDMLSRLEIMEEPIIILNEELRIIGKNRLASKLFFNLRRNRRINAFLNYNDLERIARMTSGEMTQICLFGKEAEYHSVVVCGDGFRVLAVSSLFANLHQSIENIYEKSSGYEMLLQSPLPFGDSKTESKAEDILSHSGADRTLGGRNSIFTLTNLIKQIQREIRLSDSSVRVSVGTDIGGIFGSEYDFAMVISYLLAFFDDKTCGCDIELSVSVCGNDAVVTVSADTVLSDYEVSEIVNGNCHGSKNGYWFKLLAILAEGNLWKFSIHSPLSGRIVFRLETPLAESLEGCVLRDVDIVAVRKIIAFVFNKKIS